MTAREATHLIGRYDGAQHGALVLCVGAMHGNEPAGPAAIRRVLQMLQKESVANAHFVFRGRFLGLLGNTRAFEKQQRFICCDLNRQWTVANVQRIERTPIHDLTYEELEIRELLALIRQEIIDYRPTKLVLLDLHTTSSDGGIFTIPANDDQSLSTASAMCAPVVQGLTANLVGTTLHYFCPENWDLPTIAVCFEAGQHADPLSARRSVAAIINCLRTVGNVAAADVENRHDELLLRYSTQLPRVTKLLLRHAVLPDDEFKMQPNYQNFQPLRKGEILAYDRHGAIVAPKDCLLLMPLYQSQGSDGFFLVEKIS